MSFNYLDENGLLYFWQKIKAIFAKQTDLTNTNGRVTDLENTVSGLVAKGGEPNVIETVKVNGTALGVTDKAVDISVPTNNNQLTNGAGYQTSSQVSTAITNAIKNKQDTLTFDTTPTANSENPVTSGGVKSALDLKAPLASPTFTGTPKAPTAAAGTNTTQLATTAFVGTAVTNGVKNKADKATTLSGYGITDAYTKTQTDSAIATAVAGITGISFEVVTSLPSTGVNGTIYLVSNSGSGQNSYDEYIYVNNAWEKLGTTDVDLSGYVQTSDLVAVTNAEIDTIVAS